MFLVIYFLPTDINSTEIEVNTAIESARSIPEIDWKLLQSMDTVKQTIDQFGHDTSTLEALRKNGQGILLEPGQSDVRACQNRNDVHCLAVQEIMESATKRPSVDPDVTGKILLGRDHVIETAEDHINLDKEFSSGVGICRPIFEQANTAAQTKTCEVRTIERETTEEDKSCTNTWEEIFNNESQWMCIYDFFQRSEKRCSIPVVVKQKTTSDVICFQGSDKGKIESCSVSVQQVKKSEWIAQCTKPYFKVSKRTCSRRLLVKPIGTCVIGEQQKIELVDEATLLQDGVPGADRLVVFYVCSEGAHPRIYIGTNTQTSVIADRIVSTAETSFNIVDLFQAGSVNYDGTNICDAKQCVADVMMTVFKGRGQNRVQTGALHLILTFQPFKKIREQEYWAEECRSIDKTKEKQ